MHIISKAPFEESARKYPNDALAHQALYRVIKETDFSTPEEMRTAFPNLDNFRYRNNGTFWMSAGTILGLLPT